MQGVVLGQPRWRGGRIYTRTGAGQDRRILAKRLLDGDKRALARAITLIENDPAGWGAGAGGLSADREGPDRGADRPAGGGKST